MPEDAHWLDIDFRPAPPGWIAITEYDDEEGKTVTLKWEIAGWLIQNWHDPKGNRDYIERRVIPAVHDAKNFGPDLVPMDPPAGVWAKNERLVRILPPTLGEAHAG